jgi:hypothetical protein
MSAGYVPRRDSLSFSKYNLDLRPLTAILCSISHQYSTVRPLPLPPLPLTINSILRSSISDLRYLTADFYFSIPSTFQPIDVHCTSEACMLKLCSIIFKTRFLMVGGTLLVTMVATSTVVSETAASSEATLTISSPSSNGVILPEIDEFATMVLGDPWDMNDPTDIAYYRATHLANPVFDSGIFSAQLTQGNGAEAIILLTAGAVNNTAMRIGKTGYKYPINADRYRYLSFRMYSSNPDCNSGLVEWYADDSYSHNSMGITTPHLVPPEPCIGRPPGWYTYVIDLKQQGLWQGGKDWSGTIRELILHPFAGQGAAGATVKLDWVRLTAADPRTARPFIIRWSGDGLGGPVTLYARRDAQIFDDNQIIIASNLSASGGSYTFQTGTLPPGTYYIAAANNNGAAWSEGPLVINAPPQVTITKPSMTSGQEYATVELGRPWDMSSPTDINHNLQAWQQTCLTNQSFAGGLYSASLLPNCPSGEYYGDPILYLGRLNRALPDHQDPVIDTQKYRYLSYRFYHSGEQNVEQGWVARFGWWQVHGNGYTIIEEPVMGRDMIIHEGWNVYEADLWAPDVVDEAHPIQRSWHASAPNRLRFDPSELANSLMPATIKLDWIRLTAVDEVTRGQTFPIRFSLRAGYPVTMTFYYDSDKNPHNGRHQIGVRSFAAMSDSGTTTVIEPAANSPTSGHKRLYLPLTLNNYCSDCYLWNTATVAPGTYYICIETKDPYNTMYYCSEAPVIVR